MTSEQSRIAWMGFFAVVGGSALASLAGAIADDTSSALLAVTWGIGAFLAALWVWSDDVDAREFRFTRDGWSALGWICAFLFPPAGILLGIVLHARRSAQGRPMVLASLAALAGYAILA